MRSFLGMVIIFTLSGCQPKVGSDNWFKQTPTNEVNLHYLNICSDYGFKNKSPEMATCIQKEILAQKERNSQNVSNATNLGKNMPSSTGFSFSFTKKIN